MIMASNINSEVPSSKNRYVQVPQVLLIDVKFSRCHLKDMIPNFLELSIHADSLEHKALLSTDKAANPADLQKQLTEKEADLTSMRKWPKAMNKMFKTRYMRYDWFVYKFDSAWVDISQDRQVIHKLGQMVCAVCSFLMLSKAPVYRDRQWFLLKNPQYKRITVTTTTSVAERTVPHFILVVPTVPKSMLVLPVLSWEMFTL